MTGQHFGIVTNSVHFKKGVMNQSSSQKEAILPVVILFSLFLVVLSGLYLWAIIPDSKVVEINGKKTQVTPNTFVGTVLESTINE